MAAKVKKTSRARIASVKNIHKITRAMEMVAAARLPVLNNGSRRCGGTPRASVLNAAGRACRGEHAAVPILAERETPVDAAILVVMLSWSAGAFILPSSARACRRARSRRAMVPTVHRHAGRAPRSVLVAVPASRIRGPATSESNPTGPSHPNAATHRERYLVSVEILTRELISWTRSTTATSRR